jgi:dTDP-glucose 4,6-dehydratase
VKIIVTGGAGFIGSHFVNLLLRHPDISPQIDELIVLDKFTYAADENRLSPSKPDPRLRIVRGNILDESLLLGLIPGTRFVFNFAAESHVDNSIRDSKIFLETNILGVQSLINVISSNLDTELIQVSTDEVYGEVLLGDSNESDVMNPSSPYSASKAAAELLIMSAKRTYGVRTRITRGSNTYGEGQFPEKIIPFFVQRALEGKALPLYGDGNQTREWLHVSDHAKGIWLAAIMGKSGDVFNLGSGLHLTNLEVAQTILKLMNLSTNLITFVDDRKGHDRRYSVNSSKAKQHLGFNPDVNFEENLARLIRHSSP